MFTLLADCFVLLAGVAYPAYASFKVVKYRNVQGYVRWMCYWVVYAAYTVCERTVGTYLLSWLPGYDIFRCLVVLWLVAPLTRGAQLLYKHVLHPQLSKHEAQIDTVCVNYAEALKQGGTGLLRYAVVFLFQSVMKMNGLLFSYIHAHSLAQRGQASQLQYGNVGPIGLYPAGGYGNAVLFSGQEAASPNQGGYAAMGPGFQYPGNQFGMASPFARTFSMESLNDGFEYVEQPQGGRSRSTSRNDKEPTWGPRSAEAPETQTATSRQPNVSGATTRTQTQTAATTSGTLASSSFRTRDGQKGSSPPKSTVPGASTKKGNSLVSSVLSTYERSSVKK